MQLTQTLSARILSSLISYATQFTRKLGHTFDDGVIRLTAMTGSAATEIKGSTIHLTAHINAKSPVERYVDEWINTRMLIIDEISFADYKHFLTKLSKNLEILTEDTSTKFGNLAVVFIGDFFQLVPNGKAIYEINNGIFWEQQMNCFIELKGTWRFKCEKLKRAFDIYRKEGLTSELRDLFNSRVIGRNPNIQTPSPLYVKYTTWTNQKREEINNHVFDTHLSTHHSQNADDPIPNCTVIIKASAKWSQNAKSLSFAERQRFYQHVREVDTHGGENKRSAPLLKLFFGAQVMYKENKSVSNGIANGTTATFQRLSLKPGPNHTR